MFDRYLAPDIKASKWFNSPPLTLASLRGKVVMIDFWTYSCINCLRTLPHMNAVWRRYRDKGLVMIGVHSPEFEFEKGLDNLRAAIGRHLIEYPVAADNDFATWTSYQNKFWPTQYFIDKDGNVRHIHEGEGGEGEIEAWIVRLLREAGKDVHLPEIRDSTVLYEKDQTREVYAGSLRGHKIGNPPVCDNEGFCLYTDSDIHEVGIIYLEGYWDQQREFLRHAGSDPGKLILSYIAKEVNAVLSAESQIEVEVLMDGFPMPRHMAHQDVHFRDGRAFITVERDDMFYIVMTPTSQLHTLALISSDPTFKVYALTFG